MNAICHRDLYEEGGTIMVEVYDDRVEISNPGGLLPVVAAEFGHKSMSRNPLIFGLFTRMHVVEKVGSGIPRMRRLMKEAELPEPQFNTRGFFTVTFMKRAKTNSATNGTKKKETGHDSYAMLYRDLQFQDCSSASDGSFNSSRLHSISGR